MKRIIVFIIGFYLIIAVVMLVFAPKPKTLIKMLVVEHQYSQLITGSSELFEVLIYLSEENSFLSTKSAILDARLLGDDAEMEMKINQIVNLGIISSYQNDHYYVFRYSYDISQYAIDHLSMVFENAILEMTYENDYEVAYEIGDVSLKWETIPESTDFDFYRLSGIYGSYSNKEILQGIAIGFDRFIEGDIIIKNISCDIHGVTFDLSHAIQYDEIVHNMTLYETLGSEYNPINYPSLSDEYVPIIAPSVIVAIPLNYHDDFIDIWRFPLYIDYEKNGEIKTFIIDDFMYRSEPILIGEESCHVHTYQYLYRN